MKRVKLIGITKPVLPEFENQSSEDIIAYCARVSNPKNQNNFETASKLLAYCIRNKHWSPFEMVNLVMEIQTSRTIVRQILRHRSFSFQEFSGRYSDPRQNGFLVSEARYQDEKNRQNSIETDDDALKEEWIEWQKKIIEVACHAYDWAIKRGVAKEVARDVLPEGLTTSRLYMQGSLRSWIHYAELRTGNGTQKEHRLVAQECKMILMDQFPFLREYWA